MEPARTKPTHWGEWQTSPDRPRLPVEVLWVEWLLEHVNYHLARWALLDVLGRLAQLSVLVAAVSYLMGAPERAKQRQYAAWEVIAQSYGKTGTLGRQEALQDLNADTVALTGIDLRYASLPFLELPNARLAAAVFDSAVLLGAEMGGADLSSARLQRADLRGIGLAHSNLSHASLSHSRINNARFDSATMREVILDSASLQYSHFFAADLGEARLRYADAAGADFRRASVTKIVADSSILTDALLEGANIAYTSLKGANLRGASLAKASLFKANLEGAQLENSDLESADLAGADLRFADLKGVRNWREIRRLTLANVYGVRHAPAGFVTWAIDSMGAVALAPHLDWVYLRVLGGIQWEPPGSDANRR